MPEIHLWSGLRHLAGGEEIVAVEGNTIGQMLDALVAKHPRLEPAIKAGVSVAVDGQIKPNNRASKVSEESEIFLLQKLRGG